jgi:hypothetical protein
MFAALCTPLSYMGYDLPTSFIGDLRAASGVPADQVTSTADSHRALHKLIPDAAIQIGLMSDETLLRKLASGEIAARVMVHNLRLPPPLRRFVGKQWDGVHAIALARAIEHGDKFVTWLDPMGAPVNHYRGTEVPYADVSDALLRRSGKVQVTFGERNAALHDASSTPAPLPDDPNPTAGSELVLSGARVDEFVHVEKGTQFRHPRTLEPVTRARDDGDFMLGGRTLNGRFFGVWVNTRRIRGAKGLTLLLADRDDVGRPFIRSDA